MADKHWHVVLVCDELSLPPVILADLVSAQIAMGQMEDVVQNVTGLEIISRSDDGMNTTFFGGHRVTCHPCTKNCIT